MRTSTQERPATVPLRRSVAPDFRLRLTIGQRVDIEVANRYRYARLVSEVSERLRAL
jgi:hypothetical protein